VGLFVAFQDRVLFGGPVAVRLLLPEPVRVDGAPSTESDSRRLSGARTGKPKHPPSARLVPENEAERFCLFYPLFFPMVVVELVSCAPTRVRLVRVPTS